MKMKNYCIVILLVVVYLLSYSPYGECLMTMGNQHSKWYYDHVKEREMQQDLFRAQQRYMEQQKVNEAMSRALWMSANDSATRKIKQKNIYKNYKTYNYNGNVNQVVKQIMLPLYSDQSLNVINDYIIKASNATSVDDLYRLLYSVNQNIQKNSGAGQLYMARGMIQAHIAVKKNDVSLLENCYADFDKAKMSLDSKIKANKTNYMAYLQRGLCCLIMAHLIPAIDTVNVNEKIAMEERCAHYDFLSAINLMEEAIIYLTLNDFLETTESRDFHRATAEFYQSMDRLFFSYYSADVSNYLKGRINAYNLLYLGK